jgi:hypothetical protein
MPVHSPILATLALAVLLASSTAYAEDASNVKTTTDSKGYGFVFSDDPIEAGGLGGITPRIAVVVHASRSTLIRPRTAFVVEMLKSVENL